MYFGRDGVVSACCYTRSAKMGRYPDQSIEEIWTGAEANSMRAAMRRNELPGGCDLCADQFYARNFKGFLARQYDDNARLPEAPGWLDRVRSVLRPQRIKRYPTRLDFELSNKCNLECVMCSGFFSSSIRANRDNLPPLPQYYDKAFVEQLLPFLPHLTHAKFLGGEPFLIDLYYSIWDNLIKVNPGCSVSITTNGTVYTDKVKRVLEMLNCEIIVSLDSVTKSTYESIRRNATLERTLDNVEKFAAINRLKKAKGLTIAICPMASNYREIPELMTFAGERGIRVFFNTLVYPATQSIKALPQAEQREVLEVFRSAIPEPRTEIEKANREAIESFCRQIQYWINDDPSAEPPALDEKYAALLARYSKSGYLTLVLSDLAGRSAPNVVHLIEVQEPDPVVALKGYMSALWEAAGLLQAEGQLQGMSFDTEKLTGWLEHIQNTVEPERARSMFSELRRFPREMLRFAGSCSGAQLIELLESHHPRQSGTAPKNQ